MSKYTTEVRFICQNWTDDPDANIDTLIDNAIPHIFNSWWNAGDHTKDLQRKILRHYYTQEIGYETVGLWKLHLNQTLSEIMPRYNILYSNLNAIRDKLFQTADWNEDYGNHNISNSSSNQTSENNSNDTNSTISHATEHVGIDSNDTQQSNAKDTSATTSTTNDKTSSNSTSDATSSSESWQEYNDTPQGSLDQIQSGTYLTNATKNKSDSTSHSTTSATGSDDSTSNTNETSDSSSTSKGNRNSVTDQTDNSDSTSNASGHQTSETNTKNGSESNADGTRHVYGKNSGGDYLSQYLELQNEYNDIDQMVIADLQPLFMGLWE